MHREKTRPQRLWHPLSFRQRVHLFFKLPPHLRRAYGDVRRLLKDEPARSQVITAADILKDAGQVEDAIRVLIEHELLADCAQLFLNLGRPKDAARLYAAAENWASAATCFLAAQQPLQAARCFAFAKDFGRAAKQFAEAGHFSAAARSYMQASAFLPAAKMWMHADDYSEAEKAFARWLGQGAPGAAQRLSPEDCETLAETVLGFVAAGLIGRARTMLASDLGGFAAALGVVTFADAGQTAALREFCDSVVNSLAPMEIILPAPPLPAFTLGGLDGEHSRSSSHSANAQSENHQTYSQSNPSKNQAIEHSVMSEPRAFDMGTATRFALAGGERALLDLVSETGTGTGNSDPDSDSADSFNEYKPIWLSDTSGNEVTMSLDFSEVSTPIDSADFFTTFTDEERSVLWRLGSVRDFQGGEVLVDFDDEPAGLFTVLDGEVELSRRRGDQVVAVDKLQANGTFGQMWSMLQLRSRVRVIGGSPNVKVHIVERRALKDLIKTRDPKSAALSKKLAASLQIHILAGLEAKDA